MRKTIGVLAHVDAGKTTLSEALLVQGGVLRAPGRVDQQNTMLDSDGQERTRGITIFASQAAFPYGGDEFTLVDTPGHVDFSAAMERTLAVLDAAVLVISATDSVQGHTETIWQRLASLHLPVFFFVSKCDRMPPDQAIQEIRRVLSEDCIDLTGGLEPVAEDLAARDEKLLDAYLSGGFDASLFSRVTGEMITSRKLFPIIYGSAFTGQGVSTLLDALCTLLNTQYDDTAPLGAQIYGMRRLSSGERLALVKITSGTLRPRDRLGADKAGELRLIRGAKSDSIPIAQAGACCAVSGLASAKIGDGLGAASPLPSCELVPLLTAKATFDCSAHTALSAFRVLEEEDPALSVQWEEEKQQLTIRIMGRVQLEVLTAVLDERFGLSVSFSSPQVTYRETILAPAIGVGHYEPLRHYAECVLRLNPAPHGSGITFSSECSTDKLAGNWQRLIESHVFERKHLGVLTGSPLTDVHITLLCGRAHEKHTEGGDFREAVYRAIRQGLMRAQSRLLEPRIAITARTDPSLTGRLLSDIQRMHGEAEPPKTYNQSAITRALVPLAKWDEYPAEFAAYTHGRGALSTRPGDWAPCANEPDVISAAAYEPERDLAHTPDSVFCSHGAGFTVKWHEVPTYMHCKE